MHGQYVSGYLVQHHLTNLVGTFATGKLVKAVVRKQILHSGVKVYGTSCKIENQISSAPEIVYKVERRTMPDTEQIDQFMKVVDALVNSLKE